MGNTETFPISALFKTVTGGQCVDTYGKNNFYTQVLAKSSPALCKSTTSAHGMNACTTKARSDLFRAAQSMNVLSKNVVTELEKNLGEFSEEVETAESKLASDRAGKQGRQPKLNTELSVLVFKLETVSRLIKTCADDFRTLMTIVTKATERNPFAGTSDEVRDKIGGCRVELGAAHKSLDRSYDEVSSAIQMLSKWVETIRDTQTLVVAYNISDAYMTVCTCVRSNSVKITGDFYCLMSNCHSLAAGATVSTV